MSLTHNIKRKSVIKRQQGSSKVIFIAIAVLAIGFGIFVQGWHSDSPDSNPPTLETTFILPAPKAIKEVNFSSYTGQEFSTEQLKGQWSILFFGFTNCPDVCPSTLRILKDVKEQVSQAGFWNGYQVIMVSVDPERDTPEKLANYVPFFDTEFIGITGDIATTKAFAKNVGTLFIKQASENSDEWYDVDHSASLVLINPQGQWAGAITAPHNADQISRDLVAFAQYNGVEKNVLTNAKTTGAAVVSSGDGESTLAVHLRQTQGTANQSSLMFKNAWVRPTPGHARSTAAYFQLINNSKQDIIIVDSQSPNFEMTMIHDTQVKDGLVSMNHLDELLVPAGGTVELKPLGLHMMLMQPSAALNLGDSVPITLIDDQGRRHQSTMQVLEQAQ